MSDWVIQDEHVDSLAPLTDLRASFELRTGGLTTLERLTKQYGCSPSGFYCENDERATFIESRTGLSRREETTDVDHPEFCQPWDLLTHLPTLLERDLEEAQPLNTSCGDQVMGDYRVDVHKSATIMQGAVLDATHGAIRVEEGAVIRPNAVLIGPCWIAKGSIVYEHALIKSNTVIGPVCKVSGEIGGTIFQGYSNKCHEGHLGDSVIGEWVNFGAGTTNSNVLNTFGEIVVKDLQGQRHKTGRDYVGCFVGDHTKFAICTRIMTGTIIGTGAMIASSSPPPSPTKRFAWITDAEERTYKIDKFLDVARTVMARRDQELDQVTQDVIVQLANAVT